MFVRCFLFNSFKGSDKGYFSLGIFFASSGHDRFAKFHKRRVGKQRGRGDLPEINRRGPPIT